MDTPYRLKKLLSDLIKLNPDRDVFLGCDLGGKEEFLIRGNVPAVLKGIGEKEKREFVMVISPRK